MADIRQPFTLSTIACTGVEAIFQAKIVEFKSRGEQLLGKPLPLQGIIDPTGTEIQEKPVDFFMTPHEHRLLLSH